MRKDVDHHNLSLVDIDATLTSFHIKFMEIKDELKGLKERCNVLNDC